MDKEINKSIPIMFQKRKSFETKDTRFTKVTIWLMHLEENLNGSYFSKESVENAIPSLANTPILAYIEENKLGEKDASNHREVLVKEDGQYKIKYIGQAYGVIPESCNPRFQTRVCDDGIEREFLVVDGLMWTEKFDDINEILNRDHIKGQSMELYHEADGYFDENDNLYHFTDFKFYGACILGDFVQPAMKSSTVEVMNFSVDEFKNTINSKMEEFKQYTNSQKEVELMEENKIDNVEVEQTEVKDEFATVIKTTENVNISTTETIDTDSYKVEETKIETTTVEVTETIDSTDNQNPMGMMEQETSEDFSAETQVEEKVSEVTEETVKEVVTEPITEEVTSEPIIKLPTEESFNVLETEEYKALEVKYSELEKQFNTLNEEVVELKVFKANKEDEELKAKVDKVSSDFALEEAEISDLKAKAYSKEISLEVYEEKLFALVGKKNFSKAETQVEEIEKPLTFSLKQTEQCPYPSLSQYFQ